MTELEEDDTCVCGGTFRPERERGCTCHCGHPPCSVCIEMVLKCGKCWTIYDEDEVGDEPERKECVSNWKPYDYVVMEKLTGDKSEKKPKVLISGRLVAKSGDDAKIRVHRLPDMITYEPEDVEVSVNCPF